MLKIAHGMNNKTEENVQIGRKEKEILMYQTIDQVEQNRNFYFVCVCFFPLKSAACQFYTFIAPFNGVSFYLYCESFFLVPLFLTISMTSTFFSCETPFASRVRMKCNPFFSVTNNELKKK